MAVEVRTFKSLRRLRPANITYTAGATHVSLVAIRGAIETAPHPLGQVGLNSRTEDFIVLATELKSGDDLIEPTPGHRITETVNDQLLTYEVCRKDDQPCWRWMGHDHALLRIFVKLVSIA